MPKNKEVSFANSNFLKNSQTQGSRIEKNANVEILETNLEDEDSSPMITKNIKVNTQEQEKYRHQ